MNLDNYIYTIHHIIKNRIDLIRNNPYVVGVGYGRKIINNKFTNIPCLTFLVKEKVSKYDITAKYIVPKYLSGVLTDVIAIGEQRLCANEKRPALGGMSVSNGKSTRYGTIACAVTEKKSKKRVFLLSCNHVLTTDLVGKTEKKVLQPGIDDGGEDPKSIIGLLDKIVPMNLGANIDEKNFNEVDAAIAYIGPNDTNTKTQLLAPYLSNKDVVVDIDKVKSGGEVWRIGAESGKVKGTVITTLTTAQVNFDGKDAMFINQIFVKMPSLKGDSGALGVAEFDIKGSAKKELRAFGMLMSATSSMTIFNPIDKVLEKLGVELITSPF